MTWDVPRVGIGVLIFRNGNVLLGKRKGSHGAGEYQGTGGHLEHGESFEDCAARETLEETGMRIQNIRFNCLTNFKDHVPKHYVDIGLIADWKYGEPVLMEPRKCEGWDWYGIENLPRPLFGVVENYILAYRTGRHYFDA